MPTFHIRVLGPNDEKVLTILAQDDADFDIAERGQALKPLSDEAAGLYLSNPSVCHWVAEADGKVLGFLYGHLLPLRSDKGPEFLLYEMGVRKAYRKQGLGKDLVKAMLDWMDMRHIKIVWVIADNPGALAFYKKCGFQKVEGSLTQMEIIRA